MRSATDDILLHLKTRGPAETGAIGKSLGITRQAARQHLENLSAEGLVTFETFRKGIGRPAHAWSLTEKGHARFPDTHAQMTVELLENVRSVFGEEGLSKLIRRRERETQGTYEKALTKCRSLESRVAALVALRSAEGYMSEWSKLPDGNFLLIENHCPICAAAKACQGFCRSELSLFAKALDAKVERTEHVLAGARRCAYRISGK
ncbi:MAG TPA: metalloregulator ArsR/SmtB family transcription factor [Rhizomicrobium sp.]|nr:metalloregulator ArsR/SmtB family transcription factor [Rhizomicrobium sp.]